MENERVKEINQNNGKRGFTKNQIIGILIVIAIVITSLVIFVLSTKNTNNEDVTNSNSTSGMKKNENSEDVLSKEEILEKYSAETKYDSNGNFLFMVEDSYTVADVGDFAFGLVERGQVSVNDEVEIIGLNDEVKKAVVTNILLENENITSAKAGDLVAIHLKDITKKDIKRGKILAEPNSVKKITKFVADVYFLSREEGGRVTPFFDNCESVFYNRAADVKCKLLFPEELDMILPGNVAKLTIELSSPLGLEIGDKFSIRKDGKTVGKGIITSFNNVVEKDTSSITSSNTTNSNKQNNLQQKFDPNGKFLFNIEDVFTIKGVGVSASGIVINGSVKVNDKVQIIGLDHEIRTVTVKSVERFRVNLGSAKAGDEVAIVFDGVAKEDVERGQVLAFPDSIKDYKTITADLYLLRYDEGGLNHSLVNNYKCTYYNGVANIPCIIKLNDDLDEAKLGENVKVMIDLESSLALEVGNEFIVTIDGGHTIGKGTVLSTVK